MKRTYVSYLAPILWGIAGIALFLYSYTQVDLSLTLSRVNVFQTVERAFQYVGFYQRPLSTLLYLVLLVVYFALYVLSLRLVAKGKITRKIFFWIVGILIATLVLSYPAFSYDMFNYMFTAKSVMLYHKNPYLVVPLQFSGIEPWLSFMRWTHLPSAYTPLWILLTLPSYVFGFGFFLGIMWNIKIIGAICYFVTTWYIGKILGRLDPKRALMGMAIFALNPLILYETLVSGHNDIVMMALAMIAYDLYLTRRRVASFFVLSLSVAAKLMTLFLVPVFLFGWQRKFALWAMIIGFCAVASQREILPWYVVWLVPFYALLPRVEWTVILGTGLSFGMLLTYAPVLFTGVYDPAVQSAKLWFGLVPFVVACLIFALRRFALIRAHQV